MALKQLKVIQNFFRGSKPGPAFLVFIAILLALSAFYKYPETVFYPPQSIHAWRQADCASLALNYYRHGMKFFHPRIHLLVSDNGTSGYAATSEIPVFYYTIAWLYKIFGVHESLIRIINLIIFLTGLFYLFKMLHILLKDYFWSAGLAILLFTSPVLVYYANNYLTNASAFALGLIGFYHFLSFSEHGRTSSLYYSALFYLLAGAFKITGLFMLIAIIAYFFLEQTGLTRGSMSGIKTFRKGARQVWPFFLVVLIIFSWIIYARCYNTIHHASHFSTTIFPIWNLDLKGIQGVLEGIRKLWLPSYFNRYTLILIGLMGLSIPFNYRFINPLVRTLTILLLPIVILFIILQFWTFSQHDYYTINLYILAVMILAASFNGLQNRAAKAFKNHILKGLFALFLLYNVFYAREESGKRYAGWLNENSAFLVFREIREKLPEFGIHPDDTVICLPGSGLLSLYLVDMDGWTAYVDTRFGRGEPKYYNSDSIGIRESIRNGARYLFIMGIEEIYRKPFLMDFTRHLSGHYKDLLVFDLLSDDRNFNIGNRQLKLELTCDMENLSPDGRFFRTSNDSIMLTHGISQSGEQAFNGSYSSKLSKDHAFSLSTGFDKVTAGESFVVSTWIYDPKDQCRIIASGENPDQFYYGRRMIEVADSLGWQKIKIDFFVPAEMDGNLLNIYLFYPGADSVYVDDLEIKYFNKPDQGWLNGPGTGS
jgi:hypothetical protein